MRNGSKVYGCKMRSASGSTGVFQNLGEDTEWRRLDPASCQKDGDHQQTHKSP